jgi:hypothetical protein
MRSHLPTPESETLNSRLRVSHLQTPNSTTYPLNPKPCPLNPNPDELAEYLQKKYEYLTPGNDNDCEYAEASDMPTGLNPQPSILNTKRA